jgi:predicted nucleic acid-binding protein
VIPPFVYDAGALIAFDNNNRRMWARHQVALEEGRDVHIPAIVIGQAWRDGRRQARLAKVLASCRVDPVGTETAKAAGVLCGKAGSADVVDATVALLAASLRAIIWTSDAQDIKALTASSGARPALIVCAV